MADGITFKLNIKEVVKNITVAKATANNIVREELASFGTLTVNQAKRLAPVDEGLLRNSISATFPISSKGYTVTITVNVNYAAYIEFGTKSFAAAHVSSLPPDWQAFAAQFKGKGSGTFQEFVKVLTEWVMRKGFAAEQTKSGNRSKSQSSIEAQKQAAYMIALSILRKGIRPHPYLWPAYRDNVKLLVANLKAQLSK